MSDDNRRIHIQNSMEYAHFPGALSLSGTPWSGVQFAAGKRRAASLVLAVVVAICTTSWTPAAFAASELAAYLPKAALADFFPGADRFGPTQGDPPIVPAYRGYQLQGFVYLNSDLANAIGYSGKPIKVLIGIDPNGVITGLSSSIIRNRSCWSASPWRASSPR